MSVHMARSWWCYGSGLNSCPFVVFDHPSNTSVWFSPRLTGETVSQSARSSCLPSFYCPQTFFVLECSLKHRIKSKARGYSYSCRRCDFVRGLDIFLRVWHLKAQCGKEPTDNGSFFSSGVSRWCCRGGILTGAADDLMAGFRTDGDSSFWEVTVAWFPLFSDRSVDTQKGTQG